MNTEKIMEDIQSVQDNIREIKSTWGNTIMTLENIKSGLKADVQKKVDEAYQRGHDDGYEAGCATAFKPVSDTEYQRGLEDAWEAARKIIRMPDGDILDLFPDCYASVCTAVQAILKYDTSEAIAKLKAYEDKRSDRLEVGDEVIAPCGKAIVTAIKNEFVYYLYADGDCGCTELENLTKTGRHFDIQSILGAMKS